MSSELGALQRQTARCASQLHALDDEMRELRRELEARRREGGALCSASGACTMQELARAFYLRSRAVATRYEVATVRS